MLLQIITCFGLAFILDIIYIGYLDSAERALPYRAGFFSVAIAACSTFSFFDMVSNKLLVIPYFAGIFLGTIVGIKIKARKVNNY